MATIREVVLNAVSVLVWQNEQQNATSEAKKEHYKDLLESIKQTVWLTDGDVVNAVNLLGNQLRAAGWKPNSIKVRRSEFKRIIEGRVYIVDGQDSWKGALKDIKLATTVPSDIVRENLLKAEEQLEKLTEKVAALREQLAELENPTAVEEAEITFTDEINSSIDEDGVITQDEAQVRAA